MRQEFPSNVSGEVSIAAVGGPCIAGELAGRRQSCVYFGSRELETAQHLAEIFRTDYYHVWTTDDIEGLEFAVALKNAYALGVGIALVFLKNQAVWTRLGVYAQFGCRVICVWMYRDAFFFGNVRVEY